MNLRYLSSILILIGTTASSWAATIIAPEDGGASAQAYRDAALPFTSVGEVKGSGLSGSGVYIGGGWVLTAGHIAMSKGVGSGFVINGQTYNVTSSIVHENFNLPNSLFDIGLVRLESVPTGIDAAIMYDFGSPDSILGSEATWVGYGQTGTGLSGAGSPFERRAFTNVIDVLGSHPQYEGLPPTSFIADFDRPGDSSKNNPASSTIPTELEGNLAPGDSGGGVFLKVNGVNYLVGINSYRGRLDAMTSSTNSRYGSLSGASHLDFFYDWIEGHTDITPVPEPSAAALVALGAMTALSRRRRFRDA